MIDMFTALVFKTVISGFVKMGYSLVSTLISRFQNSGLILVAGVVYEEMMCLWIKSHLCITGQKVYNWLKLWIIRVESILELNVHFIIDFYCLSMIWPSPCEHMGLQWLLGVNILLFIDVYLMEHHKHV